MAYTVDDTIIYILLLTRHIRMGDVSAALLALLIELGFSASSDGFTYLRKAILMRYRNPECRFGELYREIGHSHDMDISASQVEQAIRNAIDMAWRNRTQEWGYFFCDRKSGKPRKPSNGDFIATIACVLELWSSSCREVCYERK